MAPPASAFYLVPPAIPYLKILGIVASGLASGTVLSFSWPAMPTILVNPNTPNLAKQWLALYDRGKLLGPTLGVVGGVSWLTVATLQYRHNLPWKLAAFIGAMAIGHIPYTAAFMLGTNNKLMEYEKKTRQETEEVSIEEANRVRELVDKWGTLNIVRGCLPLVGFLVGVWSVVIV